MNICSNLNLIGCLLITGSAQACNQKQKDMVVGTATVETLREAGHRFVRLDEAARAFA